MVVLTHQAPRHSLIFSSSSSPLPKRRITSTIRVHNPSSSTPMNNLSLQGGGRFMEFPHLSDPHKNLMVDLVSAMENALSSHLLPSSLPPEIQYFQNETGTSQGSLHIRSGTNTSPVDCILGSWIHCKTPLGALDITTLTAYLNSKTDAPRFLIEFIQSSPTSSILLLDLPPRKDLMVHTDYLCTLYEETQLEQRRKRIAQISEVRPYIASSLHTRYVLSCVLSPTAVCVAIDCEAGDHNRMEEVIRETVGPVAKEMLEIWLDQCVSSSEGGIEFEMGDLERAELEKRDHLIKKTTVEIDLASSLPRLFGAETGNSVLEAIRKNLSI